jgi:hypothetical protein
MLENVITRSRLLDAIEDRFAHLDHSSRFLLTFGEKTPSEDSTHAGPGLSADRAATDLSHLESSQRATF